MKTIIKIAFLLTLFVIGTFYVSSICPTVDHISELITDDTEYTGCTIYMEDVIVSNYSHLNVRAERLVNISGPFEVPIYSSLDIQVLF